jgi:hypothetical protein
MQIISPHPDKKAGSNVSAGLRLANGIASTSIVLGLVAIAAPPVLALTVSPAEIRNAVPRNRFDNCTDALVKLNISPQEAVAACARAFNPGNLSKCVQGVSRGGAIAAPEALSACRQVRNPEKMSECFTDIRRQVADAPATEVLRNCSATILPDQFSNCVQGISKAVDLTPTEVMNSCITVRDFVPEFDPTFIRYTTPPAETLPPSQTPAPLETPAPITPPVPSPAPAPAEVTPQRY